MSSWTQTSKTPASCSASSLSSFSSQKRMKTCKNSAQLTRWNSSSARGWTNGRKNLGLCLTSLLTKRRIFWSLVRLSRLARALTLTELQPARARNAKLSTRWWRPSFKLLEQLTSTNKAQICLVQRSNPQLSPKVRMYFRLETLVMFLALMKKMICPKTKVVRKVWLIKLQLCLA